MEAAPYSGVRRFLSADVGFPVAVGAMWLASLLLLLFVIRRRLKVWCCIKVHAEMGQSCQQ